MNLEPPNFTGREMQLLPSLLMKRSLRVIETPPAQHPTLAPPQEQEDYISLMTDCMMYSFLVNFSIS